MDPLAFHRLVACIGSYTRTSRGGRGDDAVLRMEVSESLEYLVGKQIYPHLR
jgi:hypothetical protein